VVESNLLLLPLVLSLSLTPVFLSCSIRTSLTGLGVVIETTS
jgi:hypothetical protein